MTTSPDELPGPLAAHVEVSEGALHVRLTDGRIISVPLAWYPRLVSGTSEQRACWHLTGSGMGIHWPELDEDVSVAALLNGEPSAESPASVQRWLATRSGGGGG